MSHSQADSRPQRRRWGRLVVLVLVIGVLACGGWLTWSAQQARHDLQTAQSALHEVQASLLSGQEATANAALHRAATAAASAHHRTDGPLWAAVGVLPVVGDVAGSVRGLASVADRLVAGPVSTLVSAAGSVNSRHLWSTKHGVAVDQLRTAAPPLTNAASELRGLRQEVAALPSSTVVHQVDQARASLLSQLTDVSDTVTGTARLARVAPGMLGADGPRRYLLVFQNPAESRGTGGLFGAYGVLEARHGKLHVARMGPNSDLHSFAKPVIDLGKAYAARYNGFGATRNWQQANVSPHFPDAGRTWVAMWQKQTGQHLDGVIATDPVAMGYLLDALGPVRLPGGQQITGSNAVRATLHDAYRKYDTNEAQNAYFQRIAHAVVRKVFSGAGNPAATIRGLGKAAGQRRLLIYSTDRSAEAELAQSSLGGVLPDRPGPFAGLVVNSIGASKLDYYLDRSVSYVARGVCQNGTRHTLVSVKLTNTAPAHGLPTSVVNHLAALRHRPGTERLLTSVFLAQDATMDAITIDGKKGLAGVGLERGHTVVSLPLDIAPGQTRSFVIDVTEPASGAHPTVPVQPLVRAQETRVHVPPC